MPDQYLSAEGLEKLRKELEERKSLVRGDITRKILDALELGDLSENAEYISAREMQSFNEGRIVELEEIIKNAHIISKQGHAEIIVVGATVKVESKHGKQQFTIVGPAEANPVQGFISNESPLGSAFVGRKKGDEVEVRTPGGMVKYKILEVA